MLGFIEQMKRMESHTAFLAPMAHIEDMMIYKQNVLSAKEVRLHLNYLITHLFRLYLMDSILVARHTAKKNATHLKAG